MFEYINLTLGGLRETKSQMWENWSKVDFTKNSDQYLESLSHTYPIGTLEIEIV